MRPTQEIERSQQTLWKTGSLAAEWARRFPELFDEDDLRLTKKQGPLGYHFYEWLAAIVLHHATGYLECYSSSKEHYSASTSETPLRRQQDGAQAPAESLRRQSPRD